MESKLLSKVIDEKNIAILHRANVTEQDFYTQQEAYKFILNYTKQYGEVPEAEAVVSECDGFNYTPDIKGHFNYMVKQVKNATAKRKAFELCKKKLEINFRIYKVLSS